MSILLKANVEVQDELETVITNEITPLTGTEIDIQGELNMNSNKITNLGTPTNTTDATTKEYVDNRVNVDVFSLTLEDVRSVDNVVLGTINMGNNTITNTNLQAKTVAIAQSGTYPTYPYTIISNDGYAELNIQANANGGTNSATLFLNKGDGIASSIRSTGSITAIESHSLAGSSNIIDFNAWDNTAGLEKNSSFINQDTMFRMSRGTDGATITNTSYGILNMNSNKITNLANGTESGDVVNKSQLDAVSTNLSNLTLEDVRSVNNQVAGDIDLATNNLLDVGTITSETSPTTGLPFCITDIEPKSIYWLNGNTTLSTVDSGSELWITNGTSAGRYIRINPRSDSDIVDFTSNERFDFKISPTWSISGGLPTLSAGGTSIFTIADPIQINSVNLEMNSNLITGLGSPVSANDAVRKTYVDSNFTPIKTQTNLAVSFNSASTTFIDVSRPLNTVFFLTKIDNLVHLRFAAVTVVTENTTTSDSLKTIASIPADYRPTASFVNIPVYVRENGNFVLANLVIIGSGGGIEIYKGYNGTFSPSALSTFTLTAAEFTYEV